MVRLTVTRWLRSEAPTRSAALAFYTLFAMAPVLLVFVAFAGGVLGRSATGRELAARVETLWGPEVAAAVQEVLSHAADPHHAGIAGVVGILGLFVGATAVFAQLQRALNAVWEVQPRKGQFLRRFLRKRLISFGLVLAFGVLLTLSLLVGAALSAFGDLLERRLELPASLLAALDIATFVVVLALLFAAIFRLLPDARLDWRDVAVGAAVTALLLAAGRFVIGTYLGVAATASVYGVGGSVVLLLLWVYYSSMTFLLGAGFTRVWSRRYRLHGVVAEPGAERVDKAAHADQT